MQDLNHTGIAGSRENQSTTRSRWIFRKLWPHDGAQFRDHLLRLDPDERACRFGHAVADEWIAAYCEGTDWIRSITLGCWVEGDLRGVGELKMLDRARPSMAEFALSVEGAFDSSGIGSELLRRLVLVARNRGIARGYLLCLPVNRRIQRIVRKLNPALAHHGDQIECELALALPTALTIGQEIYDDGCAAMQALWDWQQSLAPVARAQATS
jgi:GNAT superfamily N-acetyltransferase